MATINIIKGNAVQLEFDNEIIAFATSHSLQKNTNVVEIACKDSGDTPTALSNGVNWTVNCDCMYSVDGYAKVQQAQDAGTPVTVKFGLLSNYAGYGEPSQQGLSSLDPNSEIEAWSMGSDYEQGTCIIENCTVTAQYGTEATFSCTLRGSGKLVGYGAFATEDTNSGGGGSNAGASGITGI